MILDSPPPLILDDEGMTATHAFIKIPTGVSRGSRDRGQRCREASSWARNRTPTRTPGRRRAGRATRRAAGDGRRAGGDRLCRAPGVRPPARVRQPVRAGILRLRRWRTSPGTAGSTWCTPTTATRCWRPGRRRSPPASTTATSTGCGWPTALSPVPGRGAAAAGRGRGDREVVRRAHAAGGAAAPRPLRAAREGRLLSAPRRGHRPAPARRRWPPGTSGPPTRRPSSTPPGCGTASPSSRTRTDRGDGTAGGKGGGGTTTSPPFLADEGG